jgi:NADPH:quinone reductase-like Zn-dependent oxidoreductase
LNSGNILDINNNKFEVQLLSQTKEKGCDIVIHALPTEFLGASFQCVNKFGAFIHIGSQDVDVHTQIGENCLIEIELSIFYNSGAYAKKYFYLGGGGGL